MNINNIATPVSVSAEVKSIDVIPHSTARNNTSKNETGKNNKVQDLDTSLKKDSQNKSLSQKASISAQETREIVEELNEFMTDMQTNLGFDVRKELNNQVVVEIKDRKTDEMIKQIPAEEMLVIKEKMEELTGLLFDQSL
jgi:flagellar protein FlaG